MTSTMRFSRRLLPAAGAATLAATAVAGWAPFGPAASAQPSEGTTDAAGSRDLDGTYESCAAYFGFGKWDEQAMDIVEFGVTDRDGSDGVDHTIADDTHVVLVLTNEDGDTLECLPEEITEEQWDDEMDDLRDDFGSEVDLPAWPGPGRYAYPTIEAEPFLEGFGDIREVGFRVAGIPNGHTLESPLGVKPLTQHHSLRPWTYASIQQVPSVLDAVEAELGAQARADLIAAYEGCDADEDPEVLPNEVIAFLERLGGEAGDRDDYDCYSLAYATPPAAYVLAIQATAVYREPIVLALPEEPTTTTTAAVTATTAVAGPAPTAPGAAPIRGTADYTG
jgi:hypothetical protein